MPDEERGDSLTPTLPQQCVRGEVVNRERDPKCKQTEPPRLRSGGPLAPSALGAPLAWDLGEHPGHPWPTSSTGTHTHTPTTAVKSLTS